MRTGTDTEATPDSLLESFKGKGLKPIVIFTLVVHAVVIIGSSIPFFLRSTFAAGNAERSRDERVESAVDDATEALRKIAKKHDLNPQDISDQFSGKGTRTGKAATGAAATSPAAREPAGDPGDVPVRDRSAYETNLETKIDGPSVPTFNADDDDIF